MSSLEKEMLEVLKNLDELRIDELEQEGLTHSDAVSVAMSEAMQRIGK
jgi:hypothetical protein